MNTQKTTLHKDALLSHFFLSQEKELVSFLQTYLKIDTSLPNPDYQKAIDFLTSHAKRDGFDYHVITLPSSYPVFVVTLEGKNKNLPALALNHHIDVVPAPNIKEWKFHPFSGAIDKGKIYGRGTLDTKGMGTVHYHALKNVKKMHTNLNRTIHLLMVPHEENGGFLGVKQLVQLDAFKKLNIGHLIDEGAASGNKEALAVRTQERRTFHIRLTARGKLNHGSQLKNYNVVHDMILFLSEIAQMQKHQKVNAAYLDNGELFSCNVTSIRTGVFNDGKPAINVIPDFVESHVDIRIPPKMCNADARNFLENIIKNFPGISYEVITGCDTPTPYSEKNSFLFQALKTFIEKEKFICDSQTAEGTSDMRYYRQVGIDTLGFAPFTCVSEAHNTNESIEIKQLTYSHEFMYNFLLEFCS